MKECDIPKGECSVERGWGWTLWYMVLGVGRTLVFKEPEKEWALRGSFKAEMSAKCY